MKRCDGRTSGKDLGLAAHARRQRAAAAQEGRRRHRVQLLRTYRAGELPDTQQVTLAAFLAPLGVQLPNQKEAIQLVRNWHSMSELMDLWFHFDTCKLIY